MCAGLYGHHVWRGGSRWMEEEIRNIAPSKEDALSQLKWKEGLKFN